MQPIKADILATLRGEILQRQGLRKTPGSQVTDLGLGNVCAAFPDRSFPLAAVHEFVCSGAEDKTASTGFVSGLLSSLLKNGGACMWIGASQQVFPPGLLSFGIDPSRVIFCTLPRAKEQLWVMEEALKCDSLSAVVGDIAQLDFTASRRLQLAVEQSKVTGFLIRQTKHINTTACVSRWRITAGPSALPEGMPGVGFPRWKVELLKIRGGQAGAWTLEWKNKKFREIIPKPKPAVIVEQQKMTG